MPAFGASHTNVGTAALGCPAEQSSANWGLSTLKLSDNGNKQAQSDGIWTFCPTFTL
jgi:hypothetical protein